ncbi:MAG: flagellar export protein FliJ [Subdoligranulum sp.]|nr:flagellar export protein FliJ [Subdoligranulum sp.]MBD5103103.1 flagellar export protein FliJ [Subdoligranulum sp.]
MKKFEFTMRKILDLKNNILEAEKNRLSQLQEAQRRIEAEILQLEQAMQDISQQMINAQTEGVTVAELMAYNARRANIRMQLEELALRLSDAIKSVDHQMQIVVEASREVSKFEKVEERQYEVYREGEKKAENARVEELVANNVCRRQVV